MGSAQSTIQSLKTVDQWIDVINANINGGVRTGFKSSRLKFTGSNADIQRPGTMATLPLQLAETGLMPSNTVIDWSQGAVTASTENSHLAIQGEGFFLLNDKMDGTGNDFVTRDGEFRVNQDGYLVTASGLFLFDPNSNELVYDDSLKTATNPFPVGPPPYTNDVKLSNFLVAGGQSLLYIPDKDRLEYTKYGSTVWNYTGTSTSVGLTTDATILSKSLEASNASMTQSVPELSLAQKLFSALTKVLQINSTNTDALLGLIR